MTRLALPLKEIRDHYTVVVVGSGYGGSIAASRMARVGGDVSVCLLERGVEFAPGEFPDTLAEAKQQMQVDMPLAERNLGSPTGLYDFRVNEDINVFLGCGLGGTSLVNANVSIEPEAGVFDDPRWPAALRGRIALKEYYERARAMLKPRPYPDHFPKLKKTEAQRKSAEGMGKDFKLLDINVHFGEEGPNHVGVPQKACVLCGDCVTGCNHGAKNTTAMNYLPDARNHGAHIFCETKVTRVERGDGHWIVHFTPVGAGRERFDAPAMFVKADVVVLAAGTLGSTEILLRSKQAGLSVSDKLGERFTGNGDVLAFGYNADQEIRGIGFGSHSIEDSDPVGPCITAAIDCRGQSRLEDSMIVEEGVIPGALDPFVPSVMSGAAGAFGKDTDSGVMDNVAERTREIWSLVRGARHGATNNTQTYLVMAHDDAGGKLRLQDDRLRIDWPSVGEQPVFQKIGKILEEATKELGGTYMPNPAWTEFLGRRLVTVHPLGGCVMAESGSEGVVDERGRVFSRNGAGDGDAVHEGLYVMDGAVIPRPLGANPLLTISAIAERSCQLLAEDRGWSFDTTPSSQPSRPAREPERLGIRFTETMRGWLDHESGERSDFEFTLTVSSSDLETMLREEGHRATMFGTVTAPGLDDAALTTSHGEFQLFVKDPDVVNQKRMVYDMRLHDQSGHSYRFRGHKKIRNDAGLDLWEDTTKLYFSLDRGVEGDGGRVGQGELRIEPADFARQMQTMQVLNASSTAERLEALARFGAFFSGSLFDTFAGVFARPSVFDPEAPPRKRRELRVAAPELHSVRTADGTEILLTRYSGGGQGPVILAHGLGVGSSIFSLDTIDTNLLEFLFAHGYDVWLLDYRASIHLPAAEQQFSGDDIAREDYPAAVAKVREITGADTVQMVVHCFGSTTFVMSMLGGHLSHVRSAVCSQMGAHVIAPTSTRVKTGLHTARILEVLGFDSLTAYVDANVPWQDRLFDSMLNLTPVQREEHCRSPVCHRITFLYSMLYEHDQLNTATHDTLHETFGIGNIKAFQHLSRMTREKKLVGFDGDDLYLPHLDRMNIPVTFIHGAENACFLPKSTELTFEALRERNGPGLYSRHVIGSYGHIDCIFGKNAVRDVYPFILEHLERT